MIDQSQQLMNKHITMHNNKNNYIISVSFVRKTQDPDTYREAIENHTFFLPLSDLTNDYATKLKNYVGKEGTVNV